MASSQLTLQSEVNRITNNCFDNGSPRYVMTLTAPIKFGEQMTLDVFCKSQPCDEIHQSQFFQPRTGALVIEGANP